MYCYLIYYKQMMRYWTVDFRLNILNSSEWRVNVEDQEANEGN